MKSEEKQLIESLFHRLEEVEKNSSKRDEAAEILINSLVKKQINAPYYMTQTILVQETVLNKLNSRLNELEKEISKMKNRGVETENNSSFLSGFFHKKNRMKDKNNSSILNSNDLMNSHNYNKNGTISNPPVSNSSSILTNSSSFLSNALQTAVGVAGGMVVGNMLTNLFHHQRPEEEIFTSINNDTIISNVDNHTDFLNNDIKNDDFIDEYPTTGLIDSETNSSDISSYSPSSSENFDSFNEDIGDDNFI